MNQRAKSIATRVGVVVLSSALLVGLVAAPAEAASPKILVSTNGTDFGSTMTSGIFDDVGLLVPLDTYTKSLWIKNPTSAPASMRVSVRDLITDSSVFANSVTLTTIDSKTGHEEKSDFADLANCQVVVPSVSIGSRAVIRVDFTISVKDVPDLVAQDKSGRFTFRVAMRDGEAGPFPASACDDNGVTIPVVDPPVDDPDNGTDNSSGGSLPFTGGDFPTAMLVIAGALVGFGLILLRRRRRDDDREVTSTAVDA